MLLKDCQDCKYCRRMIGVGLGVRCSHPENQKFKRIDESHPQLPVIISRVSEECGYKTLRK
jgi:hypothetical protein